MSNDWAPMAEAIRLTGDEVQVWRIDLSDRESSQTDFLTTLSAEEVERAGRLRAGQVRMQFLAGRSCLRRLLGAELGIAPSEVPIVVGKYGKPELGIQAGRKIYFNVAHSRSTVLVALSLAGPVGVDIEYLDRATSVTEVARHSLTEHESAALLAIDDILNRSKAFFECWTRKEAVVKADGRGLSLPLTSFEVPVGVPCLSTSVDIFEEEDDSWHRYFVSDIALDEGTACAIAVGSSRLWFHLLKFLPAGW